MDFKKLIPAIAMLALASTAFAQVIVPASTPKITFVEGISRTVRFIFIIILVMAVIFILYAGWLFVTAQGDVAKIEKAKGIIFWAIIGIVVASLAWGIILFVFRGVGQGMFPTQQP